MTPLLTALAFAAAALASACAAPVPPGGLSPPAHRNTNEAREVDLRVLDAWGDRLGALMASADGSGPAGRERLRALGMADAWLAFARDEYVRLPSSPIVDTTFARARAAIEASERGMPADTQPLLVIGTERKHQTLWVELARLAASPDADPAVFGETTVLLVRAGRVPIAGDTLSCDPAPFLARAMRNLQALAAATRPSAEPRRRPPVRSVYFGLDSDTIPAVARRMLDDLAELLDRNPGVRVELEGLTDPRGTSSYNLELAQRRALAIQQYLAARTLGVSEFEVRPLGRAREQADLRDIVGLARDRRVDVRVILPDGREAAREDALDGDLQVEPVRPAVPPAPPTPPRRRMPRQSP